MPQERSFQSQAKSAETSLPAEGVLLCQMRNSDSWQGKDESIRLVIDLPATIFSKPAEGNLISSKSKWNVEVGREGPELRVKVGDVLVGTLDPVKEIGRLTYLGRALELRPWEARRGVWLDGKLVATWWSAWKDQDLSKDIDSFFWIDRDSLGGDWQVLAICPAILRLGQNATFASSVSFSF